MESGVLCIACCTVSPQMGGSTSYPNRSWIVVFHATSMTTGRSTEGRAEEVQVVRLMRPVLTVPGVRSEEYFDCPSTAYLCFANYSFTLLTTIFPAGIPGLRARPGRRCWLRSIRLPRTFPCPVAARFVAGVAALTTALAAASSRHAVVRLYR